LNLNNELEKKNFYIVLFCTSVSRNQIKNLNTQVYSLNLNLYFLDELISERVFNFLFNIQKFLKRDYKKCVCGNNDFYIFKGFRIKAKKVYLLDEGFQPNLINDNFKQNKFIAFTVFNIQNTKPQIIKNSYVFLKGMSKKYDVQKDLIFLLGTGIFLHKKREKAYINILNVFLKKYKSKKIFYVPHRSETDKNLEKIPKEISIKKINQPIETFMINNTYLPEIIAGFYSTALYNFKIILSEKKVQVLNVNFDLNKLFWEENEKIRIDMFNEQLNNIKVCNFNN